MRAYLRLLSVSNVSGTNGLSGNIYFLIVIIIVHFSYNNMKSVLSFSLIVQKYIFFFF